jgi:hypothetical protein
MDVDVNDERQIVELWTTSGTALVLTGHVTTLARLALRLNLPEDTVVETRHGQAALGLWGSPLAAYQELTGQQSSPRNQASLA